MSLLSRAKKALTKNEVVKAPREKAVPEKREKTQATQATSQIESAIELGSILTEKSLRAQEHDTVVFKVRPNVTKHQIAVAISEKYNVKPKSIRTARFHSKMRRRGRTIGFTSPWKKAYVKVDDVSKFTTEE